MPKFCIKCGSPIPEGVNLCPKCGATIGQGQAVPAAQQQPPPPQQPIQQPIQQQPIQQQTAPPPPPPPQQPYYGQTQPYAPMPKKSNKKLIIGVVLIAIIAIIVVLLLVFFVFGGDEGKLVGTWEMESMTTYKDGVEQSSSQSGGGTLTEIKSDGTLIYKNSDGEETGRSTWKLKNGKICITSESDEYEEYDITPSTICSEYKFSNGDKKVTLTYSSTSEEYNYDTGETETVTYRYVITHKKV